MSLCGLLVLIYLFKHDELRSVYLALGTVLVCLPRLHPWYLLLMAPLLIIYPSRAWLYLMAAMIATLPVLAIEFHTGVFQEIKWLKLIIYIPFFSLMIHDALINRPHNRRSPFPPPHALSVIMPVLNEAERIQSAIAAVQSEPGIEEIIVVDGGSRDATPMLARAARARVIAGPRGRGRQVRAGIPLGSGDVILILHADTLLLSGSAGRMLKALTRRPFTAGGAFGMTFAVRSPCLWTIAWLNNIRARWLGVAFGDQGQFFRRSALAEMGGFPDLMLMEDVELSLRLKNWSRPLFVPSGVRVSVRRWVRRGYPTNVVKVLKLFGNYLIERRFYGPEGIRTDYYRKYYGGVQ